MPLTVSSDLIIPELLAEAIQAEFEGMTLLADSGVAVMNNTLPEGYKGGETVTVPYFDALGEMEDITTEGDALTPEALTMSEETATVMHSGKAVELSYWAQLKAAYADPYAEVARQFGELTKRRVDKALLDAAMASLPSEYILDVYNSGSPVKLSYAQIVAARLKWGDEQSNIALLGVHSKVYGDLLVEPIGTSYNQPLMTMPQDGSVPRAAGIPVIVSDKNAKSADTPPKYTSIIAKRAALAFWYQGQPRVRVGFDPLADTDVIAIHMYFAAHRYKRVRGSGTKPGVVKIITN